MGDKKILVPRQVRDIIEQLRTDLGLKQEQMAQIMGIAQNRISNLESSRQKSHYQKHFSMFLRLIRFCEDHDISLWEQRSNDLGEKRPGGTIRKEREKKR